MSNKCLSNHAQSPVIAVKRMEFIPTSNNLQHRSIGCWRTSNVAFTITCISTLLVAMLGALVFQIDLASARPDNVGNLATTKATEQQADRLSLGSTVFLDSNSNGLFDSDEMGIPNIDLTIFDTTNTLVATATTNISGTYLATGLAEGNYYIIIQRPPESAPMSSNITNLNDDQIDDDDNGDQPGGPGAPVISPIIRLLAGTEPVNETGIGGEQDRLADDNGDMTVDFGFVPTTFDVSVGDLVWDDFNQNGIQDDDEDGLPGVTVAIFDTNTGLPVVDGGGNPRTEVTDNVGRFLFTALPPGNFYLTLSDVPVGFEATLQNVGNNDSLDSDLYPNISQTTPTGPLVDGVQYLALDAGYFDDEAGLYADIGDRVWYDYDGDGIQGSDANEYGLSDVAVTLYESANRGIVQSTTTDANGQYTFTRVSAGSYYLEFTSPNSFLIPVWAKRSADATVDSDIDAMGQTFQFTLVGGDDEFSIDAGFVLPTELEVNFWNDENQDGLRDDTEAGLNGSQVFLVSTEGERLTDVLTDSDGIGRFSVPPGTYRLLFVPPGGFAISQRNSAGLINNDADEEGLTEALTLMPNESATGWGAGAYEVRPASLNEEDEPDVTAPEITKPAPINGEGDTGNQRWSIFLPLVD